jgi:hypothetical protein
VHHSKIDPLRHVSGMNARVVAGAYKSPPGSLPNAGQWIWIRITRPGNESKQREMMRLGFKFHVSEVHAPRERGLSPGERERQQALCSSS